MPSHPSDPTPASVRVARRLQVGGQVQGVGYRPFVFRLAHRLGLLGWVRNEMGRVTIHAEGAASALDEFTHALVHGAPAIAHAQLLDSAAAPVSGTAEFLILPSSTGAVPDIHVPPDYFTCADCRRELEDPADRRYRYPFINCTQCGPRYTLIRSLPYDRPNTTMADFALCPDCAGEYADPADRRFHAQPLACPVCGPRLRFSGADGTELTDTAAALAACVDALRAGRVVAVKGIGGYHLMCDAASETAVAALRDRKQRPHKPLAVLVPEQGGDGLDMVRTLAALDDRSGALLYSPMRPVVLLPRHNDAPLAAAVAPELHEVGLMLPYSPLHYLLLADFGAPLVATSANLSGEPVLIAASEVTARLGGVADAYLHHDRPIQRPADDAVYRPIAGRPRPLRLGRGGAPLQLPLPCPVDRPVLATGAHMKNTVALAWEDRVVISPHIGDLGSPRALEVFEQVAADLQDLYGVYAEGIACDAHPNYTSTRWAATRGLPLLRVCHHHAHAAALYGEHVLTGQALMFTWDGTGFGSDGTLWGGEALLGWPGAWQRVASLRPFRLPGGERVGREPWRSALALCWETGTPWTSPHADPLLHQAWERGLNAPVSSAAGRLFDAAAALTGVLDRASFEGQGPMWLEQRAAPAADGIPLPLARDADGLWRTDWAPLLPALLDTGRSVAARAGLFHLSMARALVDQAVQVRTETGVGQVGLTGGVFQNRLLTETALALLEQRGFRVVLPAAVPCNDAGISFGQVIEAAACQQRFPRG